MRNDEVKYEYASVPRYEEGEPTHRETTTRYCWCIPSDNSEIPNYDKKNEVIVNYWKPLPLQTPNLSCARGSSSLQRFGHLSITIPSRLMKCDLLILKNRFERYRDDCPSVNYYFDLARRPTYVLTPHSFYFTWHTGNLIKKQKIIFRELEYAFVHVEKLPTVETVQYIGAEAIYVRFSNKLFFFTNGNKEVIELNVDEFMLHQLDEKINPKGMISKNTLHNVKLNVIFLSEEQLAAIGEITGYRPYLGLLEHNQSQRRQLAQLHQVLGITQFDRQIRPLSEEEQCIISRLTGHRPVVNITFCGMKNSNQAMVYYPFEMENEHFTYEHSERPIRELHQISLYSLNIDKIMGLFLSIHANVAETHAQPIGRIDKSSFHYALCWPPSLLCIPFRQCWKGPEQLVNELLDVKQSNCSKMVMACLETGGIYKALKLYKLSYSWLWLTIFIGLFGGFAFSAYLPSLKTLDELVEGVGIFAISFIALVLIVCYLIACIRTCQGFAAVCTPQGVYEVALKAHRYEQSFFAKQTQKIMEEQGGYECVNHL